MPRTTPRAVPQVGPSKAQLSVWRVIAIVAIVACVATGAQLYRVMGDRDLLHETLVARGVATSRQGASLQSDIADRDRLIGALTGPSMRVIDLLNYGSSGPVGRVFWDKAMGTWTMYTYTLPAPKPGDTYQLWIVTNDGHPPFSAGTFVPDAEGKAVVRATYAIGPNALGRIAVSEEPEGGSPAPSRHIVLAGR
jgi:anti-sigma-K factor RskA